MALSLKFTANEAIIHSSSGAKVNKRWGYQPTSGSGYYRCVSYEFTVPETRAYVINIAGTNNLEMISSTLPSGESVAYDITEATDLTHAKTYPPTSYVAKVTPTGSTKKSFPATRVVTQVLTAGVTYKLWVLPVFAGTGYNYLAYWGTQNYDGAITVEEDTTSGAVYIGDGSANNPYQVYIGNGSSFDLYQPYIGDGTNWNPY